MNILELLIILIVALIVFNPADLPKIAYQIGRFLALLQKLLNPIEQKISDAVKTQRLQENIAKAKQMEIEQQHD